MESPSHRRAARVRAEARVWPPAPATLDVVRYQPPEIARCRWPQCHAWIEWVEMRDGGLLPLEHPVTVVAEGAGVVTIAAAQCHLARCPEAPAWLRQRWGG